MLLLVLMFWTFSLIGNRLYEFKVQVLESMRNKPQSQYSFEGTSSAVFSWSILPSRSLWMILSMLISPSAMVAVEN